MFCSSLQANSNVLLSVEQQATIYYCGQAERLIYLESSRSVCADALELLCVTLSLH